MIPTMTEELARFLFDQQAEEYGATEAMRELAWADERVSGFWIEQAQGVLDFLSSVYGVIQ